MTLGNSVEHADDIMTSQTLNKLETVSFQSSNTYVHFFEQLTNETRLLNFYI